jgi:DNA-binding response OmpR family regulator
MASQHMLLPNRPRALIAVREVALGELVARTLNHGRYATRLTESTDAAVGALHEWRPHLVIMHMDDDAVGLLSKRQSITPTVPVVALTRHGDLKTTLHAFDAGVDDILSVPFAPAEFLARVLAIMRRTYRQAPAFTPRIAVGDLKIDIVSRVVLIRGRKVPLTRLEQSLLYLLAANSDRALTRNEILDNLWGSEYVPGSNIVDRHIRNLRLKLGKVSARVGITTVARIGYRLRVTRS